MKNLTAINAILAAAMAGTIVSCAPPRPTIEEIAATPSTTLLTPQPSGGLSRPDENNNPFVANLDYDVTTSFSMLTEPVEDFKGTIIRSDILYLGIIAERGSDDSYSLSRPFSQLIVRDPAGQIYNMIYPAEKTFPAGQEIVIGRYWKLRQDIPLMNNMLVYMISHQDPDIYINYPYRVDFQIESSAEDGMFDGLIELGAVEYLSPEGN